MKTAGVVLIALGALSILSGINLLVTKYDLSSSHDISKSLGGFAFATFVLAAGIVLFQRGKKS